MSKDKDKTIRMYLLSMNKDKDKTIRMLISGNDVIVKPDRCYAFGYAKVSNNIVWIARISQPNEPKKEFFNYARKWLVTGTEAGRINLLMDGVNSVDTTIGQSIQMRNEIEAIATSGKCICYFDRHDLYDFLPTTDEYEQEFGDVGIDELEHLADIDLNGMAWEIIKNEGRTQERFDSCIKDANPESPSFDADCEQNEKWVYA